MTFSIDNPRGENMFGKTLRITRVNETLMKLLIIWTGSKTNLNLIFFLDSSKRLEHIVKGAI